MHIPKEVKTTDEGTKNAIANLILGLVEDRAMASGMQFAEIDLGNLGDDGGRNAQTGTMMGPEEWKTLIGKMHTEDGYKTLLGRYVRDYRTLRETIRFSSRLAFDLPEPSCNPAQGPDSGRPEISLSRAGQVAIGAVREGLKNYLAARNERIAECLEVPGICLIGIDIGGTRTKCQLFRYDEGTREIKAVSPVFHMDTTPRPAVRHDDDKDNAARLKRQADDFAVRLVRLLKKEIDDQRDRFDCGCCVPAIVGLSWPGPVRDGRIAGTSGILGSFPPLSNSIAANAIEDIWEFDIVDAVKSSWEVVFKGDQNLSDKPYVSLLNDGDAEAVGAIMRRDPAADQYASTTTKTAVVKIGTGLAGGLLKGSSEQIALITGLYEWGKLILDVGAPRKTGFPQGVSAEYLSKRCLPRLAARKGRPQTTGSPGYFQRDDPDSAEIGLILEMVNKPSAAVFKCLVNECGIIQARMTPLFGLPVPDETLRLLLDPNKPSSLDDDLLHLVRLALHQYQKVEPQLRRYLKGYGLERLRRLISFGEKIPLIEEKSGHQEWEQLRDHPRFKVAGGIAKECVELLGCYLGDFCVLLFDELGVDRIILTGGVLSDETGRVAREAAVTRVKKYGLQMTPLKGSPRHYAIWGSTDRHPAFGGGDKGSPGNAAGAARDDDRLLCAVHSPANTTGCEGPGRQENEDRGTLGAACFSAASFIQSKKHEGLQRLRGLLLPLPAGSRLEISGSTVSIIDAQESASRAPIDFREYALIEMDLVGFMTVHGSEWGYYRSEDDHMRETPTSFVRWLVRD